MDSQASDLWNAWRSSLEIRQLAEAWITKPENGWSDEDEQLSSLFQTDPNRALAIMFAIMQITEDAKILGSLGAGQFENFLTIQGEAYLNIIHSLALEHRRLREVLDNVWQGAMPKNVWHKIEILKQSAFS
jgi:hypothetical protein